MFLFKLFIPSKIGRKLLVFVFFFGACFSLIGTSFVLYKDYQAGLDRYKEHQRVIEEVHLPSLTIDLWNFSEKLASEKLERLMFYEEITAVSVSLSNTKNLIFGEFKKEEGFENTSLLIEYEGQEIAVLTYQVNYHLLEAEIIAKGLNILVSQVFLAIFISIIFLYLVHSLVARHLTRLADLAQHISVDSLDKEIVLPRNLEDDELQTLTEALNRMRIHLFNEFGHRSTVEGQLKLEKLRLAELNNTLEKQVESRTELLEQKNQNLKKLIASLREAQEELVNQEKRLATDNMVVGLAHELNTPLGISKTTNSAAKDLITAFLPLAESKNLSHKQLMSFLNNMSEFVCLEETSINKAISMVDSFKGLSVKNVTDELTWVNLDTFIEDLICDMSGTLMADGVTLQRMGIEWDVRIQTHRLTLFKVIEALVLNACIHAFKNKREGCVVLKLDPDASDRITLHVEDNGVGIPEKMRSRIFDPFFTTSRSNGSLGIGLNIISNLVRDVLNGKLTYSDSQLGGACFSIELPLYVESDPVGGEILIERVYES